MNKKVEMFCRFVFFFTACKAVVAFLIIIPCFVFIELGWLGTVIEIILFIAAISDFRKNKKKKKK